MVHFKVECYAHPAHSPEAEQTQENNKVSLGRKVINVTQQKSVIKVTQGPRGPLGLLLNLVRLTLEIKTNNQKAKFTPQSTNTT